MYWRVGFLHQKYQAAHGSPENGYAEGDKDPWKDLIIPVIEIEIPVAGLASKVGHDPSSTSEADEADKDDDGAHPYFPFPLPVAGIELVVEGLRLVVVGHEG